MTVHVFNVLANIERVPIKFLLALTALGSEAERLTHSRYLSNGICSIKLNGLVMGNKVHCLMIVAWP